MQGKRGATSLYITRGDTGAFSFKVYVNGSAYKFADGDSVKLQVRTAPNTGDLILEAGMSIDYTTNAAVWLIAPDDTKSLDVGDYYYDAELHTAGGDIYTFIRSSQFRIDDEVTYYD